MADEEELDDDAEPPKKKRGGMLIGLVLALAAARINRRMSCYATILRLSRWNR